MTKPAKKSFGRRLREWPKNFADSIQRPQSRSLPLALEEINERKLNGGPLYKWE